MAREQYVRCMNCKEHLWIGQSPNGLTPDGIEIGVLYFGNVEVMKQFQQFFYKHHSGNSPANHEIRFLDDDELE